jgi:nucleoside-diphosphate-sugar epimerase
LNPLTAYARSKVLAERDLASLANDEFLVTCLRFATACGMSDRLRLDLVLNDFVASAVATGSVKLLSDGTAWRPLIHVRDMARAIEWGIVRGRGDGGTAVIVNAGSDTWNYRIRQLAEGVAQEILGTELEIGKDAQPDSRSYRVDFSRFRSLAPAHQPRVSLPVAVRELRAGLERMQFDDPDFRTSHLIRLRVLEALRAGNRLTERLEWSTQAL